MIKSGLTVANALLLILTGCLDIAIIIFCVLGISQEKDHKAPKAFALIKEPFEKKMSTSTPFSTKTLTHGLI